MLPWMFQILVKAPFGNLPQEIFTLLCAIMYVHYGELINMGNQHISWENVDKKSFDTVRLNPFESFC